MERIKKVLAAVLCLAMFFQMGTPAAFAAQAVPQTTSAEHSAELDANTIPESSSESFSQMSSQANSGSSSASSEAASGSAPEAPPEDVQQPALMMSAVPFALTHYEANNGLRIQELIERKEPYIQLVHDNVNNPGTNDGFTKPFLYDISYDLDLDLNGETLDIYHNQQYNGKVYFHDTNTGKLRGAGKLRAAQNGQPALHVENVKDFNLQAQVDNYVEGPATGSNAIWVDGSSILTFSEGAGAYSPNNTVLIINAGSTVNLKAGKIDGRSDNEPLILVNGGTLNISGGTVQAWSNAICIKNNGGTVNITGGDFISDGTYFEGNVKVTGGHFNSRLPAANIAEGYMQNADGWVTRADGLVTVRFTNPQGTCTLSTLTDKAPGQSIMVPLRNDYTAESFGATPNGVGAHTNPDEEFKGWKSSADGTEIRQRTYGGSDLQEPYVIPEGHKEITLEAMWGPKGPRHTWLDWDGTPLKVSYGEDSAEPAEPNRPSTPEHYYKFARWEQIAGQGRGSTYFDDAYQAVYTEHNVMYELTLRTDGNGYISSSSDSSIEQLQEYTQDKLYNDPLSDYYLYNGNQVGGFGMYCHPSRGYTVKNITWSAKANPDVEIRRPDKITEPLFVTVHFEPQMFTLWFMDPFGRRHLSTQVQYGRDAVRPAYDPIYVTSGKALYTFDDGYKNVTENNREVYPVSVSMNDILPGLKDLDDAWTNDANHGVLKELTMARFYEEEGWQVRCTTEGFKTEFSSGSIQIRYNSGYEFKAPDTGYVTPYTTAGRVDSTPPDAEWRSVYRINGDLPINNGDSLSPAEGGLFYLHYGERWGDNQSGIDPSTLKVVDEEGNSYDIVTQGTPYSPTYYVLLNKNGTYTINVSDKAGNAAAPAVREVTCFDGEPPKVEWIGYERKNRKIVFRVTDNSHFYGDQMLKVTVTGGGLTEPVTKYFTNGSPYVEDSIRDTVDVSKTDEPITMVFEDFAGNKAEPCILYTKENTSKPVVTYTLTPSIEKQPWAKERVITYTYYDPDGDPVVATNTYGSLLSRTTVEEGGHTKTVEKYTLTRNDHIWTQFADPFGNVVPMDIDPKIDGTVDLVTATIPESAKTGWHRSVDVNVHMVDNYSGPKFYRIDTYDGNKWVPGKRIEIPAENINGQTADFTAVIDKRTGDVKDYYRLVGIDQLGNEYRVDVPGAGLNIDDQTPAAPTLTATYDGAAYTSGDWAKGDITLKAANDGTEGQITLSGNQKMQMQIDDGAWTDYDGSGIVISENTAGITYRFRNVNNVGTEGTPAEIVVRRAVVSAEDIAQAKYGPDDLTINGEAIKADYWYNTADKTKGGGRLAVLVKNPKTAIGTTGPKVTTRYKFLSGPLQIPGTLGEDNLIPLMDDGLWELYIWAEDEAGNKSEEYCALINVDTTAPVVESVDKRLGSDSTYGAYVTVQVNVKADLSGFDGASFNFTTGDQFWGSSWLNVFENGILPLKVRDIAGNVTDYGTIEVTELPRKDAVVTAEVADQTRTYGDSFDAAEWFSAASTEEGGTWTYTWADAEGGALSAAPVNAGTYTVTGTYESANYRGSAKVRLTIDPKAIGADDIDIDNVALSNNTYTGSTEFSGWTFIKQEAKGYPDDYVMILGTVTANSPNVADCTSGTFLATQCMNPNYVPASPMTATGEFAVKLQPATVTEIDFDSFVPLAIEPGEAVPTTAACDFGTVTLKWSYQQDGKFGFNADHSVDVVLDIDGNHVFDQNSGTVNITGGREEERTDQVIKVHKDYPTTRKAKITSVTPPAYESKLPAYTTDSYVAQTNLPHSMAIESENGVTSLYLTWDVDGTYDPTPDAWNTFSWSAVAGLPSDLTPNGAALRGTLEVQNAAWLRVQHKAPQDTVTVTYAGENIDLKPYFELDPNAGEAAYYCYPVDGSKGAACADGIFVPQVSGSYTVTVETAAREAYGAGEKSITLNLEKGLGDPAITMADYTYRDAGKHLPQISSTTHSLPDIENGVDMLYTGVDAAGQAYSGTAAPVNAGSYKVAVTFPQGPLYAERELTADFTVKPYDISEAAVEVPAVDLTYDGTLQTVAYDTVTADGVQMQAADYKLVGHQQTNADDYTLTIQGTGNYTGTVTKPYSIKARPIVIRPNAGQKKTYGDADPELTYTTVYTGGTAGEKGLIGEDVLTGKLARVAGGTVGSYAYDISGLSNPNYSLTLDAQAPEFSIEKRPLTVNVVIKDKNYDGLQNGEIKSAELVNTVRGDDVSLKEGVTVTFTGVNTGNQIPVTLSDFELQGADAANYSLTQPAGVTGSIVNNWNAAENTEYTLSGHGWMNEDLVITAKPGYKLAAGNTVSANWTDSLTASAEGSASVKNFYVKNETTGEISLEESVTYKLDKQAPTGTVAIGRSSWNSLLNKITFGLFFNNDQQLLVTSGDGLSGVDKVEYIESAAALGLPELQASDAWKKVVGNPTIESINEKLAVCYVRITDKAGNAVYLSTDGMEFDTRKPSITGADNGSICFVTQVLNIADKNLESITLNGQAVASPVTLAGVTDADTVYTVKATDKAGNETIVTITMKPLSSVGDYLNGLTTDNVKSTNKAGIENVVAAVNGLINEPNSTAAEKEQLQNYLTKSNQLLDQIKAVADSRKAETDKIAGYDPKTVTGDDKTDLQNSIDAMQGLLDGDNLTDAERTALQKTRADAEELVEIIHKTAADIRKVMDTVIGVDAETVNSSDKNTLDQAVAGADALLATQNLTEQQRTDLTTVQTNANSMLNTIQKAADAAEAETIKKVETIHQDNVKLTDRTDLESAKADLEKALAEYGSHYTAEETQKLQDALGRVNAALQAIENAQKVLDKINALPETVAPDDGETEVKIREARKDLGALTDNEKSMAGADAQSKLQKLEKELVAYCFIEGMDGWTYETDAGDLVFRANGNYDKLTSVRVDDQELANEIQYTAWSGSTYVKLKNSYLETLQVGRHTLTLTYTDGACETSFRVEARPPEIPVTGDQSHMVLWMGLLMLSVFGASVCVFRKKKHEGK